MGCEVNSYMKNIMRKLHVKEDQIPPDAVMNTFDVKYGKLLKTENVVLRNGSWRTTSDDPFFIFQFSSPFQQAYLELKMNKQFSEDEVIFVYYASDENFTQKNTVKISVNSNKMYEGVIFFHETVQFIRFDPCEHIIDLASFHIKIIPLISETDCREAILNKYSCIKGNGIVLVSHDLTKTGAPILVCNIARSLIDRGEQVIVLAQNGGILLHMLQQDKIPVFVLTDLFEKKSLKQSKRDIFSTFIRAFYQIGYSRVLLNTIISGNIAKIFKTEGFKIITLIHEMRTSIEHYNFGRYGEDIRLYSDAVVFPAECVKKDFESLYGETSNAYIYPQGYFQKENADRASEILVSEKYILGLGTFSLRKGTDLFCSAAIEILKRGIRDYQFVWIGDYEDTELYYWLKLQIQKAGFEKYFIFIPLLPENSYNSMVKSASAFWLTSREDPFPNVMIDAVFNKVPVFAFLHAGGADSLLADGRGFLISRFDIVKLADLTLQSLKNSKEIETMTNTARNYAVLNLQFENYIQKLIDLWE